MFAAFAQDGEPRRLTENPIAGDETWHIETVAERDASQEALEQVQKITESEPVNGEDLLSSPGLKRQLREAKERLKSESADKPRK